MRGDATYIFSAKRSKTGKKQAFRPGYDRTGGAYGKYNSRSSGELKFFDTAISFTADLTSEVVAQLSLIAQGTTDVTRIGRKATIKSINVVGQFNLAPGANAVGNTTVAMYVILDKQCNGAAATQSEIFTSADIRTALRNLDNSERFVILKKFQVDLTSSAGVTTAYNNSCKSIQWYKKCDIPIIWDSTTGAITEIRSNNIFLYCGSAPQDDLVTFTGTVRLRFAD